MALTAEEYSEMADLAADIGDEQAELEALEGLESIGGFLDVPDVDLTAPSLDQIAGPPETQPLTTREKITGTGSLLAMAGSAIGKDFLKGQMVVGGLINPIQTDKQKMVKETEEFIKSLPDFEIGREGQQIIQSLTNSFKDSPEIVQKIIKAAATLGQSMGDATFEATGSPFLAAAAGTIPGALEAVTAVKTAGTVGNAANKAFETQAINTNQLLNEASQKGLAIAGDVAEDTKVLTGEVVSKGGELAKDVTARVKQVASDLSNVTSPEKQRIAKLLVEGSDDVPTAGFRLKPGVKRPKQPTRLQEFLDIGGPKIEKFPAAQDAIKQGFGRGVVAAVQGSTKADKASMRKMVHKMGRIRDNARYGMRNRPSDVTGDLLMQRLNVVRTANTEAGKSIKPIAESLAGTKVNVQEMGQSFSDSLNDMGIALKKNDDGEIVPNYLDSDIEGVKGAEAVITKVVNRIQRVAGDGNIDAFKLHKLKKFIDEQVTFGKNAEGLAGQAETALKGLRREIRLRLEEVSPKYADANATYSETIAILDRFQEVAGRKMNLLGDNPEKATGTLMRRLMGNAQSRIRLLDSIDEIEKAAFKFGGKGKLLIEGKGSGKNDLLTQVLFASELDEVFGPAARTSLQGEFDAVMKRSARAATGQGGALDVAVDVVAAGVKKGRNINEEAAFKAIRDLLRDVN